MNKLLDKLSDTSINIGLSLLNALIVLLVGIKLINVVLKLFKKSRVYNKIDKSLATFILSFSKITLYIAL